MAKIDDVYEVIDAQTKRLENLTAAVVSLQKAIKATPAGMIPPKPQPDPRIGELVAEVARLREIVKCAAVPTPKVDSGHNNIDYIVVFLVIFLCVVGADCLAIKFMKDNPGTDYAERILYNMQYADDGTGRDGSGIKIFDTEEEAQRIMNNQWRYEQEQKTKR